jgi:hypothetical protein
MGLVLLLFSYSVVVRRFRTLDHSCNNPRFGEFDPRLSPRRFPIRIATALRRLRSQASDLPSCFRSKTADLSRKSTTFPVSTGKTGNFASIGATGRNAAASLPVAGVPALADRDPDAVGLDDRCGNRGADHGDRGGAPADQGGGSVPGHGSPIPASRNPISSRRGGSTAAPPPGLVVRPASTAEVAAVVRICAEVGLPIVPQGGNTGLVGGGVPPEDGHNITLAPGRMNRIRAIDPGCANR